QLTPQLFYHQSLDSMVPEDNFYRAVNKNLSLGFLYPITASYYGRCGQESIDPVVFFKILLVGYLNNINSDRALMRFCSNCLDVRLFLGYDISESLPFHSTISRTRSLFGEELFLALFRRVLGLCVSRNMVRGKRMAVDSAFIKANASMDSLVEKEVLEDASAFVDELEENSEFKTTTARKKLVEGHHSWKEVAYEGMPGNQKSGRKDEDGNEIRPRYLSNHTHYSPTDPDAKISVKPGKSRQLNYSGQLAVDDAQHVILGTCASSSGSRDSVIFPDIMDQTIANCKENELPMDEVLADAGYSSGNSLQYCKEKGINAYIPNFGQYKPEREGFVYNREANRYECEKEGGNKAFLLFKGEKTDSKGYTKKIYRSSETDCKDCPLRAECCGRVTKFKKLDDSIHKAFYDEMHEKLNHNPNYTRFLAKRRSSRVEPVLGTLLNHHNMKRVNTRGIENANKHVLMAALTYNLKKYLKFISKKVRRNAQILDLPRGKWWFFENRIDLAYLSSN
ncbi:IS1182 family transposase, partial [Pedobacter helvus]